MHLHVRTALVHTSFLYLANGLDDSMIVMEFGAWLGAHSMSLTLESDVGRIYIRAHVHTPFARWCLRDRSFIADHGTLLVKIYIQYMCILLSCSSRNISAQQVGLKTNVSFASCGG